MSFRFSAAHSSGIRKSNPKPPSLRRNSSSPFQNLPRRKPNQTLQSKEQAAINDDDLFGDQLEDLGLVQALATDLTLRDVAQAMSYIKSKMFSKLPEERSGMNSTRVAEVLNFQRNIPPIVTVAHVQALLNSPTTVEREIAELVKGGAIRKIVVPGRGGMGEGLILVKDLENMIRSSLLQVEVQKRFIDLLRRKPTALKIARDDLSAEDTKVIMYNGFITSATPHWTTGDVFSRPTDGSRGTATSVAAVSRAASGSLAAVGGEGAVHAAGGSGGGASVPGFGDFNLATPSTGIFLKLLAGTKSHLVSLLGKSKCKEAPLTLLRERWDGGVATNDAQGQARRIRGEYGGVLPGRTRKWKTYYGVEFQWVLEEAVGDGLVEVFNSGSVGRAVRAL